MEGKKITRTDMNSMAKEYKVKYSGKKMDELCKDLVQQGAPLICKSPKIVLYTSDSSKDSSKTKSPKTKVVKGKSPNTKVTKAKSPNTKVVKGKSPNTKVTKAKSPNTKVTKAKSPNTKVVKAKLSEGEKINRTELVTIAKEYKVAHAGKKMSEICEDLVQKGAPLHCKSPKVIVRISEKAGVSPKKVSSKKVASKKVASKKVSPKKVASKKVASKKVSSKKIAKGESEKSEKDQINIPQLEPIILESGEKLKYIDCLATDQIQAENGQLILLSDSKKTKSYDVAKKWFAKYQNYSYVRVTAHILFVNQGVPRNTNRKEYLDLYLKNDSSKQVCDFINKSKK